jgi:hypothetical protein
MSGPVVYERMNVVEHWLNHMDGGKPGYLEKTCPSNLVFTTNPTWSDLGLPSEWPATKCLISDISVRVMVNLIIQLTFIGCKMRSGLNWLRM